MQKDNLTRTREKTGLREQKRRRRWKSIKIQKQKRKKNKEKTDQISSGQIFVRKNDLVVSKQISKNEMKIYERQKKKKN